jgi:Flp pilus assembly protein TadG
MTGADVLRRALADDRDRGVSTIEVVILAPVMLLFILVLVGFGQLVDGRGAVDGAARDAARAGSIQKSRAVAEAQSRQIAESDLEGTCTGGVQVKITTQWEPDTLYRVEVTCEIRGLAMLGLDIPTELTGEAVSPLDPYKRLTD